MSGSTEDTMGCDLPRRRRFLSFRNGLIRNGILNAALPDFGNTDQVQAKAMTTKLTLLPLCREVNSIGTEVLSTAGDLKSPASVSKKVV